jgi:hypothetical protein
MTRNLGFQVPGEFPLPIPPASCESISTPMPQALIFELDGVRVTPAIVQVGETSYQIANIGSVRVAEFRKYNRISILTFLLGAALLTAWAMLHGTFPDIGFYLVELGVAILLLAFVLQLVWPRWVFALMLKISTREVKVLTSLKGKFVFDVKQAIEGAFIVRAQLPSQLN